MSTVRLCFLKAALCCVALCGSAQGVFTPDMAFDDNSFPRCISALTDSAFVWEEQRIYGEEAPSRLEVETCESLSVSRTSFYQDDRANPMCLIIVWKWMAATTCTPNRGSS